MKPYEMDGPGSENKIRIDMVCVCGNMSEHVGEKGSGAIHIYTGCIYFCNQCGKAMKRRITKIETKVTETEVN